MHSTKEKILAASLELLNKNGVENVGMRDIAIQLKISVGNLTYHFPAKNDILYALCLQCIEEIDRSVAEFFDSDAGNVLAKIYRQMEAVFHTQLKYKFIFNKRYAEIITSLPDVQTHYQKVLKTRFDEWRAFHDILVKQKLAEPALAEDSDGVGYIFNMLALFWHQEAAIYTPGITDEQKVKQALSVLFHTYKPYLTKKGLTQLAPLLKTLKPYK